MAIEPHYGKFGDMFRYAKVRYDPNVDEPPCLIEFIGSSNIDDFGSHFTWGFVITGPKDGCRDPETIEGEIRSWIEDNNWVSHRIDFQQVTMPNLPEGYVPLPFTISGVATW